jgi:hypothetical protein
MLRRFFPTFIFSVTLLALSAVGARAQRTDIFVTPIPNAPFSGTIQVLRTEVQADGNVENLRTVRMIARDSRGRIRNETRVLVPAASPIVPRLVRVHLYDPQTRLSTMLDPLDRTFWSVPVNRPPATEPPALLYASPAGSNLPPSQFTKEEDLGVRRMSGLEVHGVRETQTIPADASGTGSEVVVTDEYWYSDDLRINMWIKHNDPRIGIRSVEMKVTEVQFNEPDAGLFQVPEGYKPVAAAQ